MLWALTTLCRGLPVWSSRAILCSALKINFDPRKKCRKIIILRITNYHPFWPAGKKVIDVLIFAVFYMEFLREFVFGFLNVLTHFLFFTILCTFFASIYCRLHSFCINFLQHFLFHNFRVVSRAASLCHIEYACTTVSRTLLSLNIPYFVQTFRALLPHFIYEELVIIMNTSLFSLQQQNKRGHRHVSRYCYTDRSLGNASAHKIQQHVHVQELYKLILKQNGTPPCEQILLHR